jgi:hypothetical protein
MLRAIFSQESDSVCSSNSDEIADSNDLSTSPTNNTEIDFLYHYSLDKQKIIMLKQNKILGIAHQLWPAATLLCNYIETNLNVLYPDCELNILELMNAFKRIKKKNKLTNVSI